MSFPVHVPSGTRRIFGCLAVLTMSVLITACGGGEDEPKRIPLPSSGVSHQKHDGDSVGDRRVGLQLARQLRTQCFSLHEGDTNFMWCAAGTYPGVDAGTGRSCSTSLTADGHVSFVNGNTSIRTFKLEDRVRMEYRKPAATDHWRLKIEGWDSEPWFFKSRRQHFTLTVDTARSDQIRIHQFNSDPKYGPDLDATCITQF